MRSEGRALPTKPEIVCEGKLGHFDELLFGAQTDCTIDANVRCLVRIADPSAHRCPDIADCRLFSAALLAPLVHRLCNTAGATLSAVG